MSNVDGPAVRLVDATDETLAELLPEWGTTGRRVVRGTARRPLRLRVGGPLVERIGRLVEELGRVAARDGADEVGPGQRVEGGTFRPHPYAHPTRGDQARDHRGR